MAVDGSISGARGNSRVEVQALRPHAGGKRPALTLVNTSHQTGPPEVDMLYETISFCCPISKLRILSPVRGSQCNHKQAFDREALLGIMPPSGRYLCPFAGCGQKIIRSAIKEDVAFTNLLRKYPSDDQCILFPDGSSTQYISPSPAAEIIEVSDSQGNEPIVDEILKEELSIKREPQSQARTRNDKQCRNHVSVGVLCALHARNPTGEDPLEFRALF
ncbi:hypothetical protein M427DRAFT_55164 [Gonapodya prolifera JEL478]|uniref:SP-RING-type domain-containing protein n=1 Tax=Gonapodya prolifera (strain JEL478) TaxID=1344416 RepID=A0A139AJ55_GONPJ|nr:hypothetical protein M427DRAFT_55164 [Gonapodya prolifera JEL478]|eukprot:KXS16820.1 hypothetical protein M427DRAFT_55164 [Gonapodya prolifera JEL478]